jgi:GNAT superfamily N-acetyltransferase
MVGDVPLPPEPAHPRPRWRRPEPLARARRALREHGPWGVVIGLLAETGYRRLTVMALSLDRPIPERRARLPVDLEWLRASQIDDYLLLRRDGDRDEIAHRLANGDRCIVARHEGRIVHAGWATVTRPRIDYLGCDMPLGPGDVYQFGSFTAPAFRGRGIAAARVAAMARRFQSEGYRRLLAGVQPELEFALRPLEHVGYRALGRLAVVRIGPWHRLRWRPIAKRP